MATTKFEILSMIAARDLRELHEHIAAVERSRESGKGISTWLRGERAELL
jgi:hypothetical protein